MTNKTIKFDEDLIKEVEAKAKEENRTFSGYVRHVLQQAVREREATPEEKKALDRYYNELQQGKAKTIPMDEMLKEIESE